MLFLIISTLFLRKFLQNTISKFVVHEILIEPPLRKGSSKSVNSSFFSEGVSEKTEKWSDGGEISE
jgi:hypothetical protein